MKKIIPLWSILLIILIAGVVFRQKITNKLGQFKLVHAPLGYTGVLQDPIDLHLKEATCWNTYTGSKLPSKNLSDIKTNNKLGLTYIETTNTYSVGWMQYSVPLLFPEAKEILSEIGEDFKTALEKQSLPKHKLRITSLIRSTAAQKKLTQSDQPTPYWYGYTFSISHRHFSKINLLRDNIDGQLLKDTFEKVLIEKRNQNKILVHSETDSSFFTITLRCPSLKIQK